MFNVKYPMRLIAAAVFAGAASIHVGSAIAASLKGEDITVYSGVVMAKDLFDDAGEHTNVPLFLAPDIGSTGQISAKRVATEAYNIGLYDVRLDGIETVTVHRPSRPVTREDITLELREAVSGALKSGVDFEITTSSIPALTHADPRADKSLAIDGFRLVDNARRFEATVRIATYDGETPFAVRGAIEEMRTIAVLTRNLQRDEIVAPGDVIEKRVAASSVRAGSVTSIDGLAGKAVVRNLAANSTLREQDVTEPLLVRANDPVAITYSIPGLLLTAQGRAVDSGAKNAVISVRNLQSDRIIRGRVSERGEVIVDVRKPLFATDVRSSLEEVQ